MVYNRKTEFIKVSKNGVFNFGPRVTQDPRGPHKTRFNLENRKNPFFLPPPRCILINTLNQRGPIQYMKNQETHRNLY